MARYSKNCTFVDKDVRILAGSAMFTEIALRASGEWRSNKLEKLIEEQLASENDINTGRYRKMREGYISNDHSCKRIRKALGSGRLKYWRDLPLWGLLSNCGYYNESIDRTLKSIHSRSRIYKYVWELSTENTKNQSPTLANLPQTVRIKVADYRNLDTLLILTAWAKETREQNHINESSIYGHVIIRIFAYTVCRVPHLFIRWPLLVDLYRQRIWSFWRDNMSEPWHEVPSNHLIDEIYEEEKAARMQGIKLPPPHLVRLINKPYFNKLY